MSNMRRLNIATKELVMDATEKAEVPAAIPFQKKA
jgi:hypothetical protein